VKSTGISEGTGREEKGRTENDGNSSRAKKEGFNIARRPNSVEKSVIKSNLNQIMGKYGSRGRGMVKERAERRINFVNYVEFKIEGLR
jgi:hypothetical protein